MADRATAFLFLALFRKSLCVVADRDAVAHTLRALNDDDVAASEITINEHPAFTTLDYLHGNSVGIAAND